MTRAKQKTEEKGMGSRRRAGSGGRQGEGPTVTDRERETERVMERQKRESTHSDRFGLSLGLHDQLQTVRGRDMRHEMVSITCL